MTEKLDFEAKNQPQTVSYLVQTILRVIGSPRRGHSDAEGPEKRSRPVADPLVGEGA